MCKTCIKCNISYDDIENNFYKNPKDKFKYLNVCRSCKSIRRKLLRIINAEKTRQREKLYEENNKELIRAIQKKKRATLLEKNPSYFREWYQKNKERIKKKPRSITTIKNSKERHKIWQRKYVDSLPDKYIIDILKTQGYKDITSDMIESRRQSILIIRQSKIND